MPYDKEKESSSVFNMGIATLERIDILLRKLSENYIIGNILLIQRIILILYKELYPFLNQTEKKESRLKYDKILNGVNVIDGIKYNKEQDIEKEILEFDFWIREKLLARGLLMSQADNPELALG